MGILEHRMELLTFPKEMTVLFDCTAMFSFCGCLR